MTKLFCLSPGLRVLERQMQEPPGYRPRGYGIKAHIFVATEYEEPIQRKEMRMECSQS